MRIRAAINGYGRIGRTLLRALLDRPEVPIDIVAIHDSGHPEALAHLTAYDSTHGPLPHPVQAVGDRLMVGEHHIQLLSARPADTLPWADLHIDLVFECTGTLVKQKKAHQHLTQGAQRVLISAPAPEAEATIVFGINQDCIRPTHRILSNASCTTNGLAHVVHPLLNTVGIRAGFLNTVHAYTNDQKLLDSHHSDLRRARAATHSMIPTKTGATETLSHILPSLAGKINGLAVRVPTADVSFIDFTFVPEHTCTQEDVVAILDDAAAAQPQYLRTSRAPLVSIDFLHARESAIIDIPLIQVLPQLVKVCAWYDNEWGFTQRLIDTAQYWYQQ